MVATTWYPVFANSTEVRSPKPLEHPVMRAILSGMKMVYLTSQIGHSIRAVIEFIRFGHTRHFSAPRRFTKVLNRRRR